MEEQEEYVIVHRPYIKVGLNEEEEVMEVVVLLKGGDEFCIEGWGSFGHVTAQCTGSWEMNTYPVDRLCIDNIIREAIPDIDHSHREKLLSSRESTYLFL